MFYKIREYIRSICFNFCNTLSQIFFFILRDEEYLCKYSINYYSQWESRNLNKSIELDVMEAREDPGWENSGALDKDEYQYWSQNICAIACFKMVSDNLGFSSRDIRSVSFAKESVGYGVYKEVEGEVEGIFWKSFQRFLSEKYKIESRIA
ncbi:MAG: hypothetical protein Q8L36_03765, partial [bacterium]|nr:hypothetical protein [bacterium]